MSQYEREEQAIIDDYDEGRISREEMNRQLRQLADDYQGDADEAAREAYEREMDNWYSR